MSWEFEPNSVSTDAIRKSLGVFGFAVIRNILDRQEVRQVRSELDRAFGNAHLQDLPTLVFARDAQVRADLENAVQG